MPRRVATVSVLNIKTHPHSPEMYIDLMWDVFKLGGAVKIRGFDFGMIGSLGTRNNNPLDGIGGVIYRFLNIDPHSTWLDLRTKEPIEFQEGESEDVLPVPEHLKPNLRQIPYIFYPRYHRLYYDSKYLSPLGAHRLFSKLLLRDEIIDKYGQPEVFIESTHESIQKILAIPVKRKLFIHISRPNNDDISEEAQRILDKISSQNARILNQELFAADKEVGLQPDDDTIVLIEAARSNGLVKAEGYDEGGKKIFESTEHHPIVEKEYYNSNTQTHFDAIDNLAARIMSSIVRL